MMTKSKAPNAESNAKMKMQAVVANRKHEDDDQSIQG